MASGAGTIIRTDAAGAARLLRQPAAPRTGAAAAPAQETTVPHSASWLRRHGPMVLAEVAVNIAGPVLLYDRIAPAHGDVAALLVSTVPPMLWSLGAFLLTRRVDAIALVVLAGILLSLVAMAGGGGPRFLQLRENLVTGLIGLVFLGSAAAGRPLIFQFARAGAARLSAEQAAAFSARRDQPGFRRVMTIMTLAWGFGLLASTAVACLLVFTLSIHDYLIVSPIVGYGFMGALAAWTWWYGRLAQRRADRLQASRAG